MSPTLQSTKETRYSSTFRAGTGYTGILGYSRVKNNRTFFTEVEFSSATIGKKNISSSRNLQPSLHSNYIFIRPDKISYGIDFQLASLLQFRNGVGSSNNRISYLIWNSLGISANKAVIIQLKKRTMPLFFSASIPIFSYVVRPSYSFAFTDRFLEQEHYNLALDNLADSIIKGGKLRTLNSFNHIKLGVSTFFQSNKINRGFSLRYEFSYLSYLKQKSLFQFTHQLFFAYYINNRK